jgi:NAD(P)-dependent dehydrogenase (short-subunit alcohol dehydrogenase family)
LDLNLRSRSFLVTGGSSGIGRAVVRTLLDEGAFVAACGLRAEKLRDLEREVGAPDRLLAMVCDVRDRAQVDRLAAAAAERFGGVDGVVCNAGRGVAGDVLNSPDESWLSDYEMKIFGALNPVRSCRTLLRRSSQPRIVLIGGVTGTDPHPRMAAVSASRAALNNVGSLLASELASERILVNLVSVGIASTDRARERWASEGSESWESWARQEAVERGVALERLAEPQEVADVVVFLLSARCSYMTGSVVDVSGGYGLLPGIR